MSLLRWIGCALILVSCASQAATDPDSETHWLSLCQTADDCPRGAQCLCGLCTVECTGACPLSNARCVSATDSFCGAGTRPPNSQICAAECEVNADCRTGQRCADGSCVAQSSARAAVASGGAAGAGVPAAAGAPAFVGAGGTPSYAGGMADAGGMTGAPAQAVPPPQPMTTDGGSAIGFSTAPR